MIHRGLILAGVAVVALMGSGAVDAGSRLDVPQDATPAPDTVADLLRQTPARPAPVESAPAGTPAPAAPVAVSAPPVPVVARAEEKVVPVVEPEPEVVVAEASTKTDEPLVPARRQRRPVAVIQAIDKVTAETMRFEVEVGGRPVRFNDTLIFKVRACDMSAPDELTDDAIAYVEVSLQPRGTLPGTETRQLFRGWMFASSPAVNGLQHPVFDAWVVACKA
ncbi:MAG: hypothetical protein ACI9YM_002266 [Brevundimonas sp.]|jgi:hypothetical protein|uniref:DUF2155 domain-containing protein n=1 Tax=Brevundimonas sp. TaxID=1871086 RepID=UPI002488595C|nr:DUF2155 domain-containing protein [Brevundimonas sp.]MDI1280928.1 DUF2155 domain-containing protein [Brevundimonas sp.]